MGIEFLVQDVERVTTEKSAVARGIEEEGESVQAEEPRALSARVIPKLESRLREMGLLTAIVTADSPRFRHYLKKPANLLHDRWAYLARGVNRSVLYRLGTERGLHQDLTINPRAGVAVVETCDPYTGSLQSIVFDMKESRVLSNSVTLETNDGPTISNFFFLNRREGSLEAVAEIEEGDAKHVPV